MHLKRNAKSSTLSSRACLKIEKLTDFSQGASSHKAKNAGILDGFRVFLTQWMPFPVEKDKFSIFQTAPKYFGKHIVESQMDFDKSMWGNEKTEDCIG